MKIISSIRPIYAEQRDKNEKLKSFVDDLIYGFKSKSWHYISRIKEINSFASKLETGRVSNPRELEDFFACTIVVENSTNIRDARSIIKKYFSIKYERPKDATTTHKESSSFIFDDLRLYVQLKQNIGTKRKPINDIIFEIQIKTFLQHAWSISTHDLIYKSNQIDWVKERVAFQIKAMLESAEISIEKAMSFKNIKAIPKTNYKITRLNVLKEYFLKNIDPDNMPKDLIGFLKNIDNLLYILDIKIDQFPEILKKDSDNGYGFKTKNLSPFLIVIQAIINESSKNIIQFIKEGKKNYKIFIPQEIDTTIIDGYLPSARLIRI